MTVITMSRNELRRLRVLIDIADGRLSVADATGLIGVGRRQIYRLLDGFRAGGPDGLIWSRPSSWWRFKTGLRRCRHSGLGGNGLPLARQQGSRSTAWWIVLRPEDRYQALRLGRTAARLRGLTAALRPSVGHSCRSTTQWIA